MVKVLALIIAVTFNGNIHVAGMGDDCFAAWQGVVLPNDWQTIECIEIEID